MKAKKLFRVIGQIDDTYVEQAAKYTRRKAVWLRMCAAAACVAVLVGAVVLYDRYAAPDLPMLTITESAEGGMGREAYLAPSFDYLKINDPWSPGDLLRTLPVYDNSETASRYRASEASPPPLYTADMKEELLRVAVCLGMDTNRLSVQENPYGGGYVAEDEMYTVEVTDTRVVIRVNQKDVLPAAYSLGVHDDYDSLYRTAEYLQQAYGSLLGMNNPCIDIYYGDYTFDNEVQWHVSFYEKTEDLQETVLNYNFGKVEFTGDDEGNLWMISFRRQTASVLGEYPLITWEEAEVLLRKGNYVSSTLEAFPGRENICHVELVYRNAFWDNLFLPYYKFYVQEPSCRFPGMNSYATYYVPAVEGRYVENMPLWDGSING